MNKLIRVFIGASIIFSTAAAANPREDCIKALLAKDWALAEEIISKSHGGILGLSKISSGPYAGGNLLWLAGYLGQWQLAKKLIEHDIDFQRNIISPNELPANPIAVRILKIINKGWSQIAPAGYPDLLELAAKAENDSTLRTLLFWAEGDDVADQNHDILWMPGWEWDFDRMVRAAVAINRWDIVRAIVKIWKVNPNYSFVPGIGEFLEGPAGVWGKGEDSFIVTAAKREMWDVLDLFFEMNPDLDLEAAYLMPYKPGFRYPEGHELEAGAEIFDRIEFRSENAVKGLGRLLVRRMALERDSAFGLQELLDFPIGIHGRELEKVIESFRKVFRVTALTHLNTWELTDMTCLPYEVRMNIALQNVRPQFEAMGVGPLPDSCLMKVLENFRKWLNPVPLSIARRALALRFPYHNREGCSAMELRIIREKIINVLSEFLLKHPLKPSEREYIARIVGSLPMANIQAHLEEFEQVLFVLRPSSFDEREIILREIYIKAFRDEEYPRLSPPVAVAFAEEPAGNPRKRERDDNAGGAHERDRAERESLRGVLTREIVAQVPRLTHREVRQRVEELLAVPMDIDDDIEAHDNVNATEVHVEEAQPEPTHHNPIIQAAVGGLVSPTAVVATALWLYTSQTSRNSY